MPARNIITIDKIAISKAILPCF